MHRALIWTGLCLALSLPLILAAFSPYLAWRSPLYILAGFAGIAAMALLVLQPLLASRALPGLSSRAARRGHRLVGGLLVTLIILHVGGLWVTSPPDMIDALTFRSPTPFSHWGVLAMWALFGTALLAALRKRLQFLTWRRAHLALAVVIISGTILHAVLIEGTMEQVSKWALSALLVLAGLSVFLQKSARNG